MLQRKLSWAGVATAFAGSLGAGLLLTGNPVGLWLLGATGAASILGAVSGAQSGSGSRYAKDWLHVMRIAPRYPPIPPYYAANIRRAKYPLCWTFVDGDWTPSAGNGTATDVTGTPYIAFKICKSSNTNKSKCADAVMFGDNRRTVWDLEGETAGQVWSIEKRTWVPVDDSLADTWQWFQADWTGDPSWLDRFESSVKQFIPVVVGLAVSVLATPLAGAITAAALEAIIAIADGAPVSEALVQSYKDQLQHEAEKTSYFQTYKTLSTNYNQTKDNLQKIRQAAINTYKPASPFPNAEQKIAAAVDTGIAVARAKILQDAAYAAVRARLSGPLPDGTDYQTWFDHSMQHGVTLSNWAVAMFGTDGTNLLRWAYDVAGNALDHGHDPMKAVLPVRIITPAMLRAIKALTAP